MNTAICDVLAESSEKPVVTEEPTPPPETGSVPIEDPAKPVGLKANGSPKPDERESVPEAQS